MHNLTKIKLFRTLLILTYPLALIFVLPLVLFKTKNKSKYFFFFDRYVIGGAQKVHIDILNAISDNFKQVYFTRFSPNDKLKTAFYTLPNTQCSDIHTWCDNLFLRLFSVHYYAFYINRHSASVVFSSNSTFFYDMLFFLNKKHKRIELLHNFTYGNNGMEFFGLANHKLLDHRMVVDAATANNIKEQYTKYKVPESYKDRVKMIEPGVLIPDSMNKTYSTPLKVLYAGRGGVQKRVHLIDKIAEKCIKEGLSVEFHFAGTMMDELSNFVKQNAVIHGEISSHTAMYQLYNNCHVILMTSAYEGFPMLIKEGMANGCIPVVTALDGNKSHLKNMQNALLIDRTEDEAHVVQTGYEYLKLLSNDSNLCKDLSAKCYQYASIHFNQAAFVQQYRAFLTS